MARWWFYLLAIGSMAFAACDSSGIDAPPIDEDIPAGGATTLFAVTSKAFSSPAPNLSADGLELHLQGDATFEATFVTAPATINAGLGPVYNNTSCVACHAGDGRGRPPEPGDAASSMLFRVSIPGRGAHGEPMPAPGFGGQLQDRGSFGIAPEASVSISYYDSTGYFTDGAPFTLRVPRYTIRSSYQPLPGNVMMSPRVAPPVFGLGLLEAVDESTVLAFADESDRDGDEISGRPNYVWDVQAGRSALGRFGWKANAPNLLQQAAAAYNDDMGVTTSLFPVESCHGQPQSDGRDDDPELSDGELRATAYYTQTLAVPARRNSRDPEVRRGEMLFRQANCTGCHRPAMITGRHDEVPEVSFQNIAPYTDLLLHDMGQGLADGRPDYLATGSEWRTAPLWGIGLTQLVNGHTYFLHDGRARSILEAIMWHGGEAERSREYFRALSAADRTALLKFVEAL